MFVLFRFILLILLMTFVLLFGYIIFFLVVCSCDRYYSSYYFQIRGNIFMIYIMLCNNRAATINRKKWIKSKRFFELVFVLTQKNAFSRGFILKPTETAWVPLKNGTRGFQNSPVWEIATFLRDSHWNFERL